VAVVGTGAVVDPGVAVVGTGAVVDPGAEAVGAGVVAAGTGAAPPLEVGWLTVVFVEALLVRLAISELAWIADVVQALPVRCWLRIDLIAASMREPEPIGPVG
jgi:hypothetical protein